MCRFIYFITIVSFLTPPVPSTLSWFSCGILWVSLECYHIGLVCVLTEFSGLRWSGLSDNDECLTFATVPLQLVHDSVGSTGLRLHVYSKGITGQRPGNMLDLSRTELDGDVFAFIFHGLACVLWVACFRECEEKEWDTSLWLSVCEGGCCCYFVFVFVFCQALRASCSSQIIVLLTGLFFTWSRKTSAVQALMPAPTAVTNRVLTIIDDFTHIFTDTLIESNLKASS